MDRFLERIGNDMELVYFWIKNSFNGFIKEQGFNLYGEHKFDVLASNDKWILSYTSQKCIGSKLFRETGVRNITAIVGENGSGKSTMLHAIKHLTFSKEKDRGIDIGKEGIGYEAYDTIQNEKKYNITVYITENDKFIVYDNLTKDSLEIDINVDNLEAHYSANKLLTDTGETNTYIETYKRYNKIQTKVYLSNSSYLNSQSSYSISSGNLQELNLTISSLEVISKEFYKKVCASPDMIMEKTDFNLINNIFYSNFKLEKFQEICDLIYYSTLKRKNIEKTYLSKLCKEIEISIIFASGFFEVIKDYPGSYNLEDKDIDRIKTKIKDIPDEIKKFLHLNNPKLVEILYYNLIYELIWVWDIKLSYDYTYENIHETISNLIEDEEISNPTEEKQKEISYYRNALIEINEINEILKNALDIQNILPESDLAYKNGKIINFESDEEIYWRVCYLIEKFAKSQYSFVIKYIEIKELYMSSGERAIQNMLSWLNLIPFFNEFIDTKIEMLSENLLLLIDEVDLYIHPEWQRKILDYLIYELKNQFPEKNIQLILTTHSPFVLSDLPKENIIFLKPQNYEFVVEKNDFDTFGANIHTLLQKGFFMSSTIGEFSKKLIEEINATVDKCLKNETKLDSKKYTEYQQIINIIGEPLIKSYLQEKLKIVISDQEKILQLEKELKKLRGEQ